MSSPIVFSLTGAQRDALAVLAICPAAWKTYRPAVRAALLRMRLVTRTEKPALTDAGACAAGLALFLVKASPVPALINKPATHPPDGSPELPAAAAT